jgi:hypothetical protein
VRAFTFFDLAFLGGVSLNAEDCDPGMAANGGGNNFECIPANTYDTLGFPVSGIGFAAGMKVGNAEFGYVFGDTFDSYAVAHAGTLDADESFDGAPGPGFSGNWVVLEAESIYGDDLDSYTVEDPMVQSMNSGTGFSGAWIYATLPQYTEDFDSYAVEDPLTASLNGGTGFSAAWIYATLPQYTEDFDSYAVEDPLTASLNGGTGFSSAWIYGTL